MKELSITVVEIISLVALFYGVSLVYLPAAFILAGTLGVLVCEWKSAAVEKQAKKDKK